MVTVTGGDDHQLTGLLSVSNTLSLEIKKQLFQQNELTINKLHSHHASTAISIRYQPSASPSHSITP